jgi:crotonobetainyl-CoA:carnitine CoA-transferase CaiB-like acyl-CoA transferase
LEQAVAAPFATRQLADLGARVIKIERPRGGDFARGYDETVLGQSSYFVWLNRSKESLALDLKAAAGREVLEGLLGRADVLVQNLAPGAINRLDLSATALAARHPRLIACGISGYGTTGPWRDRRAYDLPVQCETGLVSINGTPEAMARVGISVADIAAGMYAFSGILTALYQRAVSGAAPAVEVSLFEALAEWMGQPLYATMYGGRPLARAGITHPAVAPYGPYRADDGGTVLLAVQTDRDWTRFCDVFLGAPQLATDARFANNSARVTNREALDAIIAERLGELDTASALSLLDDAGLVSARLNAVDGLVGHPVLAGRDRWRRIDTPAGPVKALLPPTMFSGAEPRMDAVPAIGEHTDAILRELGYSEADVRALRDSEVIA